MEAGSARSVLTELESKVIGIVEGEACQPVTLATRFDSLGMDSLEFLALLSAVAAEIRKIPDEHVHRLNTVGDLAHVLEELGGC